MRTAMAVIIAALIASWVAMAAGDGATATDECPVTLPGEGLAAPRPFPVNPSVKGTNDLAWYGSGSLWTVLPVDGVYVPRKSVWWSTRFPGGRQEERPEISVTWERLDADRARIMEPGPGTNAHTAIDGWFMIAGVDPDEPGCWRVTADYKGESLSYVYLNG